MPTLRSAARFLSRLPVSVVLVVFSAVTDLVGTFSLALAAARRRSSASRRLYRSLL